MVVTLQPTPENLDLSPQAPPWENRISRKAAGVTIALQEGAESTHLHNLYLDEERARLLENEFRKHQNAFRANLFALHVERRECGDKL